MFTSFTNKQRNDMIETIFERMDSVFGNWNSGEYGSDCERDTLESVMDNDFELCDLLHVFHCLHVTFRPDLCKYDYMVSMDDWMAERHMELRIPSGPRRLSVIGHRFLRARPGQYYLDISGVCTRLRQVGDSDSESYDSDSDFSFDDMPDLEPQNQAFVNNILGVRSVEHKPRRSTRVKRQTDFYYGF